jgi:hypothetical protein
MITQAYLISSNFIIASITIISVSAIIFLIGILITKWRVASKNLDDDYRPAIILNLFWLAVNITVYTIFNLIPYGIYFAFLISLGINVFVGSYLSSRVYKTTYKESLVFVSVILLFLIIIGLIVGFIMLVVISLITVGLAINQ